ncbi:hypothetical protein FE782_18530 [Paenibacillus antri]|uniref:Uncharacterized protein n=1 Tax=Paenibacillus antri TaxID=2582848 RepID=A0A5R9G4J8_9BACL|nr:hypothetical protein [Paenibacillus antri]TLS50701.1 hypothetical protein FE782_18530 [Paenibacillus antri]
MAQIRSKRDAESFMNAFEETAAWDEAGGKRYFVFADRERGGSWTLMRYPDGAWTIHGKGETYCDDGETRLTAEEACAFVWKHRAAVNRAIGEAA